jgi:hypothetical protein
VNPVQHPHGNSQIYQSPEAVFVGGIYGPDGGGVYRSTDFGATWAHASGDVSSTIVWGTPNNVYSLYGWASSGEVPPNFMSAPQPGASGWTEHTAPINQGANKVAVTCQGGHFIFVGQMWWEGIWRYIEP